MKDNLDKSLKVLIIMLISMKLSMECCGADDPSFAFILSAIVVDIIAVICIYKIKLNE